MLKTTCPVLANSVDPDPLASEEANRSGSALFVIKYVNFCQKPGSSNLIGWKSEVGMASYLFSKARLTDLYLVCFNLQVLPVREPTNLRHQEQYQDNGHTEIPTCLCQVKTMISGNESQWLVPGPWEMMYDTFFMMMLQVQL